MQGVASLILVALTTVGVLAGTFIVVGWLGAFLLPIVLIILFLLMLLATGGANMPPWLILVAIPFLFLFGYGAHLVLGSTIGDPFQMGYASTMSAIKLSSIAGYGVSDSAWNMIFGIIALGAVVLLAFVGILAQGKRRH